MSKTQTETKTYDKLLLEARNEARRYNETAARLIPKMYYALRQEEHLSKPDARDRIEKDCIEFWAKRTILNALPDECKDPEKQRRAGERKKLQERFPQIAITSAADSAADSISSTSEVQGHSAVPDGKVLVDEERFNKLKMRERSLNDQNTDLVKELNETRQKLKQQQDIVNNLFNKDKSQTEGPAQTTLDKFMPALKEIVHAAHSEKCPSGCSTWKKARRITIPV